MTVLTHRRPRKIAVGILVAGLATAGYLYIAERIADATEASAAVNVACVDSSQSLWSASVTITNHWDGPTTVEVDSSSAASHEVHTLTALGETWTSHVYETSGTQIGFVIISDHPEHFTNNVPSSVPRPANCVAPATPTPEPTVPATSIAPIPTTAAPTPETSVATPPTTACAHPVKLEDGSVVCNDTYGAPPDSTPTPTKVKATPTTVERTNSLPTTGSNDVEIVAVGIAALLVGGALLLSGRRSSAT